MIIILATRNASKAEQIKTLFKGSRFTIRTLAEDGIKGEADEDGKTLAENALKKARFAFEWASHDACTMADDTGLFIDTLNGEPGIRSARWKSEKASTEKTMAYCLERLQNIPPEKRGATFETMVALITPDGDDHIFSGKVRGRILEKPRMAPQPKMPYSSIFVPEGTSLAWAEMTTEEENKISHRGQAFRKARAFLEEYFEES